MEPPIAPIRPHTHEKHGHTREDNYYWLRDRENPEVTQYLEAENAYTAEILKHTEALQEKLFAEIKGRIKEDDASVPYRLRDYFYYTRYETGGEYALHCRRKGHPDGAEEVMLDGNKLAEGHDFFAIGGFALSESQQRLAYSVDTVGRRIYTIRFKDLETGETLADEIPNVTGNLTWANDDTTLFYTRQDPETLRSYQVYRHTLGTDPATDTLVYEESDETFSTYVFKCKSRRFVFIGNFQTLSHEYRYIEASRPDDEFQVVLPRERHHEYDVDHFGDHFYIKTNHGDSGRDGTNQAAENFRLVRAPIATPTPEHWEEVVPHRDDTLLEQFEIFRDFLVLAERRGGLVRMTVRPWDGAESHEIDFGEPAYAAGFGTNNEFETTLLRYHYTSMTTPNSTYDYDLTSREKTLLKQQPVLGGYDGSLYVTERLHAPARDGEQIPISIVYRRDLRKAGENPLLLYGYGSYGASMDAAFSYARPSLLDRGFVFAIAHIRGGEEMGRRWYDNGKLLEKKNTFNDFVDCGDYLAREGFGDPKRLYAMGGSAGGLLMGAVINQRPELFHGVVAAVPFVDVVTTMLDDSIPLTTGEYDEWGNPNDKEYYDYILSYSPYDNVEAKEYPNLLVTTGLHDSQVQYWEPAKWVARLRAVKTGDHRLLLKTNLEAGHGGASGRFQRLKEVALEFAFVLDLAGCADA